MEENDKPSYHLEDTEDFGLPQSEHEPIEREEGDVPPVFEEPTYYTEEQEKESESNQEGIIIASIIGLLVLVGLAVYLFGFGGKDQVASWFGSEETPPRLSNTAPAPEPETETEPAVVYKESEPEVVEEEFVPEPVSTPGAYTTVEAITAPTGRSYIVIGSFVDEDLARDLGEKLMQDGTGIRILAPTERAPLLHRVAVADFDTFSDAVTQIEDYKLNYGEGAWVLKY